MARISIAGPQTKNRQKKGAWKTMPLKDCDLEKL